MADEEKANTLEWTKASLSQPGDVDREASKQPRRDRKQAANAITPVPPTCK